MKSSQPTNQPSSNRTQRCNTANMKVQWHNLEPVPSTSTWFPCDPTYPFTLLLILYESVPLSVSHHQNSVCISYLLSEEHVQHILTISISLSYNTTCPAWILNSDTDFIPQNKTSHFKTIPNKWQNHYILWHDAWKLQSGHLLGGASLSTFPWQHGRRRCWTANCWNTFPQQRIQKHFRSHGNEPPKHSNSEERDNSIVEGGDLHMFRPKPTSGKELTNGRQNLTEDKEKSEVKSLLYVV
jgi:hypothetical protein